MSLWPDVTLEAVSDALAAARSGHPTLLVIIGEAGMGKSTLLGEVARQASGFHILAGAGEDSVYDGPFDLLRQLGIDEILTPRGTPKDPLVVSQELRDRIDNLSPSGPVLILIDDLQWVDQTSLDSLFWLMQRARGDRFLVVAASRPEAVDTSDAWHRLVRRPANAAGITLNGLSEGETRVLVRTEIPDAGDDEIAHLWRHTGGNPFYLKSLLRQYHPVELAAMRTLPAPAELNTRIKAELAKVSDDAVSLADASAVLGYSWQDIALLAELGEVADPSTAAQDLVDAGLVEARLTGARMQVRTSHALTRAAVYYAIPHPRRRLLHLRAADIGSHPWRFSSTGWRPATAMTTRWRTTCTPQPPPPTTPVTSTAPAGCSAGPVS